MKYLKFIIQDYKATSGIVEVDLKKSLIPIIGTNESGKTSILWAIFAFDYNNDELNDGRHFRNPSNLYKTTQRGEPTVVADIEISSDEWKKIYNDLETSEDVTPGVPNPIRSVVSKIKSASKKLAQPLRIKRNLLTKKYSIENVEFSKLSDFHDGIADVVISYTPFTLYFDDFRDTVHEELEITKNDNPSKGWLTIIDQLFMRTNKGYSVYKLKELDALTRQSVLADVCKKLNETLTKEWEKFTLEEGARLEVSIQYAPREDGREFLTLVVKENIDGNDRFFGIQDRSKGFFWFFNFVMKLEFNPKVRSLDDRDTIYLLDEPGSYLHSSAQIKLCEKLANLSEQNVVIYCTHSHYLLDPDKIPLNVIRIAKKDKTGGVTLVPLPEYKDDGKPERRTALQPIIDALRIKPFVTDLSHQNICITEGIYDYYVFEMFRTPSSKVKFLPAVNAQSVPFLISIAIGWGLNYVALWDLDEDGVEQYKKSKNFFGDNEAKRFMLLPSEKKRKKYILQNLFASKDIVILRNELELSKNVSFEKMLAALFFAPNRSDILSRVSKDTTDAIAYVHKIIEENLSSNKGK